MKKQAIIQLSIIAVILFAASLSLMSCKKKDSTAATGTFYFHIHTDIDTSEVDDTTALYRDSGGRHFGLSVAQFFITNVVVHNVNGSSYTIANAGIIKDIDSEQYVIGTAPVGTYDAVSFNVGLDGSGNSLQPQPASLAAALGMWYGSTAQGYMFMKLQGFADTSAMQTGNNLVHFSYEIGSAANLKTVTMPVRTGSPYYLYTLISGGTQYIHLIADYGKLLSVVDFKTQDSTDTYTLNPATATTIAANIPNMFHYEE